MSATILQKKTFVLDYIGRGHCILYRREQIFWRLSMVSFDTIIQYFSFFGALVACVLGVLKIFDYFNNRPKLRIREVGNCYYDYAPEDGKTRFICSLEVTNVGRRTTVVKHVVAYLLSNRKKELTVYGNV